MDKHWESQTSTIKFAQLTHTVGNFGVGPKGFGKIKAPYEEAKRTGEWSGFDRFDVFCKKEPEMRNWFFENRHEIFMEMYFRLDGSLVPLDEVDVVNDLILQRGEQIVRRLRESTKT